MGVVASIALAVRRGSLQPTKHALEGLRVGMAMMAALVPELDCLIAGAVTGYGTTFASFHVIDRVRRALIDVATALAAVALAYVPHFISDDRDTMGGGIRPGCARC